GLTALARVDPVPRDREPTERILLDGFDLATKPGQRATPERAQDAGVDPLGTRLPWTEDRKSTRLNSSHVSISYAVFCLKKTTYPRDTWRRRPLELSPCPPFRFSSRRPTSTSSDQAARPGSPPRAAPRSVRSHPPHRRSR